MRVMEDERLTRPPFAPPFLKDGDEIIAQTALILQTIGERHGLAPRDAAGRRFVQQLQLTLADLVAEAHDTHHPVDLEAYYEDQKPEARAAPRRFRDNRIPASSAISSACWPQRPLARRRGPELRRPLAVPGLEGLDYAFPKAMARLSPQWPGLQGLRRRVAARPRIAAYLASDRRIPFNEDDIFRHYPELDS